MGKRDDGTSPTGNLAWDTTDSLKLLLIKVLVMELQLIPHEKYFSQICSKKKNSDKWF